MKATNAITWTAPSAAALAAWIALAAPAAAEPVVPLYDNLGKLHHRITTNAKTAQRYFDQGLRLTYGFNHAEALASFREATRLDPDCAMCYWGIALVLGPNINLPMDPKLEPAAHQAIQNALMLAPKVSAAERGYIEALAARYVAEPGADRRARDQAYADKMRALARARPDDVDAATLAAEALMDLQPWDYWTTDGKPKGDTEEIVALLERALARAPNHPGACHFYIHAVEASSQPQRALPCARRLAGLMPGAGHLVHMPAHIFMRLGYYDEAVNANARAAKVDEDYIQDRHPAGFYPLAYYPHNLHFLFAAAAMEGRSGEALNAARKLVAAVPAEAVREAPPLEMFLPTPYFALARFGRWEALLAEPAPPAEFKYVTGMWRYARAMAFAATPRPEEAAAERQELKRLADETPADFIVGLNSAKTLLQLAERVAAAEAAARSGRNDEAVAALEEAVRLEEGLTYDEPPAWYEPVRQRLGAALLASGRAAEAERVYRQDLAHHPGNGWALYGLSQSLRAQQQPKQAAEAEKRFRRAWRRADIKLTASRF